MNINLIGNIFGSSGYARHTKQLFKALHKHCDKIHLECSRPQNWETLVSDSELNALTTPATNDMISICIATPQKWPFFYTDPCKSFYGFLVWEGTTIPKYWKKYIEDKRVKGIFVPSEHVKDAILNTYKCTKPIYIIPHGVDNLIFQQNEIVNKRKRPFTFLINKGWNLTAEDRGGVPLAIKAFCQEFKKDENVRCILKINPAYLGQNNINGVSEAFKKITLPKQRNKIHVNIDFITDTQLVEMYSESDIILNTSYAEGFNIPLLEAMACKVVPITSFFGGQLDFCEDKNSFILIKGRFFQPKDLMYENCDWFKLDITQLKKCMRMVFENQNLLINKKENAYNKALEYTWDSTAEKIINIIKND